jgi:Rieske Fe-S protein
MSKRLAKEKPSRRDFLGLASICAAAAAIGGSVIGVIRLMKPRLLPEASSKFSIGKPEEFAAGTEKVIKNRNIIVVAGAQGVAAISLVCTHLGCIVSRIEGGFNCPCHGSKFDDTGSVLGGPAPRGLPWLEVSVRADGKLVVDAKKEVDIGTFYHA